MKDANFSLWKVTKKKINSIDHYKNFTIYQIINYK